MTDAAPQPLPTPPEAPAAPQSVHNSMSVLELIAQADALRQIGDGVAIIRLYQSWITRNNGHPLLYAVLFNYSVVLTEHNDLKTAQAALEAALSLNPEFAPARINLGRIYERMGDTGQSIAQWDNAIAHLGIINGSNIAHLTTALNQKARVLEGGGNDEECETTLRQSLEVDPTQSEVAQHYLAARQRQCKWPLIAPWERVSRKTLMQGLSPLSMAIYTDDPMLQLAANAVYNKRDIGDPEQAPRRTHLAASSRADTAPLRIGYLSSDLRTHAIGFLMAEMFELHDRANVEVFVYYCGIIPDDALMQRIKGTVDHWVSITGMDDASALSRMVDDGIQILVDVNGYTRDARLKLLAQRPAPVIVNWLGFPGSMGSPYHHYIIADNSIIPPEHEIYFSEKVLRLPCYQPNDRKRVISDRKPTRAEMKLPEEAVVFCCFNGTQKITQPTFNRWMQIFQRVPDSVLWLLGGTAAAQERLRGLAEKQGIAPERLIFADKMPNAQHLARYPLADLFLDTSPYGAHTTASDALWMGVPVITVEGRAFATRVCSSLVRAAGLPELVCTHVDEYVDRAVFLGRNKDARDALRDKLTSQRDSCDLFNTPKLVAHLERLYKQMWQAYRDRQLPRPDLTNLETYMELGCKQDHDSFECLTLPDYTDWWRQQLAAYSVFRPLPNDERLWTPAASKAYASRQGK